jgi:ElaB/YqjD/DUF883 family membrane-anchored ribosome-binding protein
MAEIKNPMSDADERTSRELRDDIRRTRAQMDATVDAIEEKLTPGELAHEAWSLLRGGSNSSLNRIWKIAKQYPMPAAIISLGVGLMAYETASGGALYTRRARYATRDEWPADGEMPTALDSARRRSAGVGHRATYAAGSAVERAGELVGDAGEMASDAAASVRRVTEATVDKAGELAGQAREAAGDVAESVRRQASELGRQASELGSQASEQARQGVQRARAGFWEMLEEQPLVVGVATVAAGVLVGLLLPSTPREDELMGKTRDSLVEEVKGLGQEALEKGKQIASAAADTVKQTAEGQGQPPTHRAA